MGWYYININTCIQKKKDKNNPTKKIKEDYSSGTSSNGDKSRKKQLRGNRTHFCMMIRLLKKESSIKATQTITK